MSTQAYYKERLGFDPADTVAEHHREQRSQHGYEESLSKFKDERDAIQKKTFTKWVNKHLKKASRHVGDLFEDLRDGHNLISLLEVLSGEHLPRERGRMRFHMLQNVQMALDFLRYKKIKLVNIRAEDIVDGNPKLTLGLIWTIILHFQISDIVVGQEPNLTAREALLRWARRSTAKYPGVRVTDFTGSWRDGLAFSALIHRNRPDLVDWRGARASQPRERLDRVFFVAEREYGVTRLLDPEDVDTPEPDEKSLITYISSLYDVFPEPPAIHPLYDPEAQRRSAEYRELASSLHLWIREKMTLAQERTFPPTLIEMKKLAADGTKFKNEEVPPRYRDKQRLSYIFRDLQKYFEAVGEVDMEPELHIDVIEKNWNRLIMLHQEREQAIVDEIKRLERLQRLAEKVHREMKSTDNRLEELERRVEDEARRLDRLHPLEAKHAVDLLEQDIRNTEIQIQNIFTDVHTLTEGRYSQAGELHKRVQKLHQRWVVLRSLLHKRLVQPLSAVSFPVEERVVTKHRTTVHETRLVDTNPHFRTLHDCIDWCKGRLKYFQEADYGSDLPSVENELEAHRREHKNIEQFRVKVEKCVQAKANFHGEELALYSQHLGTLQKLYAELLTVSSKRLSDLDTLHDFIQSATGELVWLNGKEEMEVTRDWSDKNLNVQTIEQYYESLMSDLEKREIQFSAVQDRGEALVLQHHPAAKTIEAYMSAMQSQWAWLLQLTLCLDVHLKHVAQSQQFFKEVQQSEQWIAKRDEILNSVYSQSDFSLDEGERLLKGMQELREELNGYGEHVQRLVERAKDVIPMKQRRQPVTRPLQVTCICSYKQMNMSIEKGEQCTLYDNSGRVKWRVKNSQGIESPVPGVCFSLQPSDKEALDAAERLRRQYDRSVALWQRKQLRLRQNMIFATIKVVKGWDLPQFLAMGQDQRTAIRKALNEDADKLLSEGDPADPQLRRLKREMADVNRLFDDFEKRARAEEESKNAGRIFNEQVSSLRQALDEAERILNSRIAAPLPRDLDSLEHMVLQHKDYEQSVRRLAPDVEQAQQTFRGITLKTPAMRNKLDELTSKWNHLWNLSNLYIERLKCTEIVLSGIEENTGAISEFEVKLASFGELPSDVKGLRNVLEDLMILQNAIAQQQASIDQLNEDTHNARRLVEKSRSSHRGPHGDVDRLDAEVNRLNARWTNVCGQLVDRLRSAEAAYGLAQQYNDSYRNEVNFVEECYGELELENAKSLLTKVVERSSAIEAVNVTGGRLIREGKIYGQRLRVFKEELEEVCPSLDASVKRPRRDSITTVDDVARDLDTLNRRYTNLVGLLQERVRQLALLHPDDASLQRTLQEQRPLRTFRTEFNIYESTNSEERYTSTTTHYTQSQYTSERHESTTETTISKDSVERISTWQSSETKCGYSETGHGQDGMETDSRGSTGIFNGANENEMLTETRIASTNANTNTNANTSTSTNANANANANVASCSPRLLLLQANESSSSQERSVGGNGGMQFNEIKSLKRIERIEESIGTDNVIDVRGIVHPSTGEVLTVGDAISLRILDVRNGRIATSIDGKTSVSIEEAARVNAIDANLANRLLGPCGVTEDGRRVNLLEAIQRELFDAERGDDRVKVTTRQARWSYGVDGNLGATDSTIGTTVTGTAVTSVTSTTTTTVAIGSGGGNDTGDIITRTATANTTTTNTTANATPNTTATSITSTSTTTTTTTNTTTTSTTTTTATTASTAAAGITSTNSIATTTTSSTAVSVACDAIDENLLDPITGEVIAKNGERVSVEEAHSRGYLTKIDVTVKIKRNAISLSDAISQGLVEERSGRVLDRVTGETYPLDEAIARGVLDPSIREIVDARNDTKITLAEAIRQGIINPKIGKYTCETTMEKLSLKEARRRRYILKPMTLKDCYDFEMIDQQGRISSPARRLKLTIDEAMARAVLDDANVRSILDTRKNETITLSEARERGIVKAGGLFRDTDAEENLTICEAVERGLISSVVQKTIFDIDAFKDPVSGEYVSFNAALLKGLIGLKSDGTFIVDLKTGKTVSLSEVEREGFVRPEVSEMLNRGIGITVEDAREITVLQAVLTDLLDPRSGQLLDPRTKRPVPLEEAIKRGFITPDGAALLTSLLNIAVTTQTVMRTVRRYQLVSGTQSAENTELERKVKDEYAHVQKEEVMLGRKSPTALARAVGTTTTIITKKIDIPATEESSGEKRLELEKRIFELPTDGWTLSEAIERRLFDPVNGLFIIPGTDRLVSFEECIKLQIINPNSGFVIDPNNGRKVSLLRSLEKGILDATGHYVYLQKISMKEAIAAELVLLQEITLEKGEEMEFDGGGSYQRQRLLQITKVSGGPDKVEVTRVDDSTERTEILAIPLPEEKGDTGEEQETAFQDVTYSSNAELLVKSKATKVPEKFLDDSSSLEIHNKICIESLTKSLSNDVDETKTAMTTTMIATTTKDKREEKEEDKEVSSSKNQRIGSAEPKYKVTIGKAVSIAGNCQNAAKTMILRKMRKRVVRVREAVESGLIDAVTANALEREVSTTLSEAIREKRIDAEKGQILDPQRGDILTVREAVERGVLDPESADLLVPLAKSLSIPGLYKQGLLDPQEGKVIHPETGAHLTLGEAIICDIVDPLSKLVLDPDGRLETLERAIANDVVDPDRSLIKTKNGNVSLVKAVESSNVFESQERKGPSEIPPAGMTFPVALKRGLIDPNGKEIQHPITGEHLSLEDAIKADFIMALPYRLAPDSMEVTAAFETGLIDRDKGVFVHPTTGTPIPIFEAVESGLLVVKSVFQKKSKTKQFGERQLEPSEIGSDIDRSDDALSSSLLEPPPSTDKPDGKSDGLTIFEAVERIYNDETESFIDPKTNRSYTLAEAIDIGLIDSNALLYDAEKEEYVTTKEALETHLLDSTTGKMNHLEKDGSRYAVSIPEATKLGLLAVVAGPVIAGQKIAAAIRSCANEGNNDHGEKRRLTTNYFTRNLDEKGEKKEGKEEERKDSERLEVIVSKELTSQSLAEQGAFDPLNEKFLNPSTGDVVTFSEFVLDLKLLDPERVRVVDMSRTDSETYVCLREAIARPLVDRNLGYMVDRKTGRKVSFFEAIRLGWVTQEQQEQLQQKQGNILFDVEVKAKEVEGRKEEKEEEEKEEEEEIETKLSLQEAAKGRRDTENLEILPFERMSERTIRDPEEEESQSQNTISIAPPTALSSKRECSLEEAIRYELLDPNASLLKDPRSGKFVEVSKALAEGLLDAGTTGKATVETSTHRDHPGKRKSRCVRFGETTVYLVEPLSFERAVEKGRLSLETGRFQDPDANDKTITLKEAVGLGLVDPDSALIKDIQKKKLVKLPEAFRRGLMDAEKGNVLDTGSSKLYELSRAVETGLLITPKRGFSFLEALEFGLYDSSTGTYRDPFASAPSVSLSSVGSDVPSRFTLAEAIDSGLIDPSSSVIKDALTGDIVSLLEAMNTGRVDSVRGKFFEEPLGEGQGESLDFVKALERGYILTAEARQAVAEKYKLCDETLAKLLQWIAEIEEKLANQDTVKENVEELQCQIKDMKLIKEDLESHARQVSSCLDQTRQVVLTGGNVLSSEEVSSLEKNGRSLKNRFDKASDRTEKLVKRLNGARDELTKFKNELVAFSIWLEKAKLALEEKEHSLSDLNKLSSGTDTTRDFVSDVIAHQADLRFITMAAQKFVDESKEYLQVLNDFRTGLPQRLSHKEPVSSQESAVRGQVSTVTGQYKELLSRANALSDRLLRVGGRQRDYYKALEKAKAWLKEIEPKVHKTITEPIAAEPKQVEDQLSKAKTLNNELLANERLVDGAKAKMDALLKSLEGRLSVEEINELKEPVAYVEDKYRQLSNALAEKCQELDTALVRCQGVQDALDGLVAWLNNVESQFKGLQRPASLQKERLEEQQREQRLLQADLDSHRLSVETIATNAQDLFLNSNNARIAKRIESKLKDVQSRFEKLTDKSLRRGEFLDEVGQALDDFLGESAKFDGWYIPILEAIDSRDLNKLDTIEHEKKMAQFVEMLESERANFEELVRNGKNLLSKKDITEASTVRNLIKTLESQWKLLGNLIDEKQRLSKSRAEQLSAYEKLRDQVIEWLTRTEDKVRGFEPVAVNLERLKRQGEELKPVQKEYRDYGNTVDKVNDLGIAYDDLLKERGESPTRRRASTSPTKRSTVRRMSQDGRSPSPTKSYAVQSPVSPGGSSGFSSRRSSQDGFHLEDLSPVQQQLSEINNRYGLLGVRLTDRQTELDGIREELRKHLDNLKILSQLLDKLQRQLPKESIPCNKDEADKIAKQIKVIVEEMYEKQSLLDSTRTQVRELCRRKKGAEGAERLNDEMEDVANRWVSIADKCKDRIRFLENIKDFYDTYETLHGWLGAKERMLGALGPISSDPRMVASQVQQVQVLREEFRTQQPQLDHLVQVGENVLAAMSPNSSDGQRMSGKLQNVLQRWADQLGRLDERAQSLGDAVDTSREFDASLNRLRDALQGISDNLDDLPLEKDPEEQLRKVENLERQLEGQRPLLADVEAAGVQLCEVLSDPASKSEINGKLAAVGKLYNNLQKKLDLRKAEIEGNLRDGRQFEASCSRTLGWLADELGNMSEKLLVSADREILQQQLDHHEPVYRHVMSKEHEVIMLLNKGRDMIARSQKVENRSLQRDLDKMQSQWDRLKRDTLDRHTRLQTCLEHCKKYYKAQDNFLPWLRQAEDKLEALKPTSFKRKDIERQSKELSSFRNELWKHSGGFENNKTLGETFASACDVDRDVVRNELGAMKTRWDKLNNDLLVRTLSLEDTARQLMEFSENLHDLQHGLQRCEDKLASHDALGGAAKDPKLLDGIKNLREETSSLRKPLQSVRQAATELVNKAGEQGVEAGHLQDEVDCMTDRIEDLQAKLDDRCNELQSAATAVTQFNELAKGISQRLSAIERELDGAKAAGREIKVVRGQAEEVKKIVGKVSKLQEEIENLDGRGERLVDFGFASDAAATREQVQSLKRQLGKLEERARNREEELTGTLDKLQEFYRVQTDVMKDVEEANDQVRKFKPVGSEVDSIRAQQEDFRVLKAKRIEPLARTVEECNALGQTLIQSAGRDVSTSNLEKDLDKMNERWNDLKERLNERDRKLDVGLLQSGKFQEALEGLEKWLTDTEEMVCNQKAPSSDYKVVKAQLQEQKFLKKMLMDRQNSMSSLYNMGQEVAAGADSKERKVIESQLKQLMGRFDDLTESAAERMEALEQAMAVAKQFQDKLIPLVVWLERSEKRVRDMELMPTDEEKIQQRVTEHDALHEDVLSKKGEFSELTETASQLMGLVGEDEAGALADKLQDAADRYAGLVERSEALGSLLQRSRQGLRHLVLTYQDLQGWMESMEIRLGKYRVLAVHTEKLLQQMEDLADLTEEVSTRQTEVDSTTDSGLELMRHISSDEALQLKDKLDSLQRRFNDLVTRGSDLLKHAQEALPLVQQFHENHSRLMDWMQAAESALQSAEQAREEEVVRLEMEISEYRPVLEKINAVGPQLCQLSPGEGAATIEGLVSRDNRRFDAIAEQIQRKAERIQLSKQRSLEVIGDIDDLLDWFREVDNQLREAEPPSSEPEIIRVQLKEHKALNDDISSQKGRVRDVISTAKKVIRENGQHEDTSTIREKMEDLRESMEIVSGLSSDRLGALEQALPLAEHLRDTHAGLVGWLEEAEQQVAMLPMPALRPDLIAAQQDRNELLLQSINEHKPLLEKLNKTGEALARLCNEEEASKVQEILENDNARYVALRAELRGRQQNLEQALQESSQFSDKLEGMLRALSSTADQVNGAEPISAHPTRLRDQMEENAALAEELAQRSEAYAAVKKAADDVISKAGNRADPAVKDIKRKLEKLNKLWTDVQRATTDRGHTLDDTLAIAEKFWSELNGVMSTLRELQDALTGQAPPAAQPAAIQQQQVALQEIRQEIDQTKPDVEQVRASGHELMGLCGEPDKPEVRKHIEDLDQAWDNVTALYARREENLIDAMEKAMEFHETLQNLLEFLQEAENKFADMGPLGSDIEEVKAQIKQLANFKAEVDPHMVKVEALNRQAAELTERTSSEQAAAIKEPLGAVNRRWDGLLRGLVERQRLLENALLRLGQFQHALDELLVWIEKTDKTLDGLKPVAGDPQVIEVELAKLKVLVNDIQAHQTSVDTLNDAGRQLIEDGKGTTEASTTAEKLGTLNRRWRDLLQRAADRQRELEDALREAQSFTAEIQDLLSWLGDVDNTIVGSKPVGGLPETASEQLERFMEVFNELEQNRPKVETVLQQGQEYLRRADATSATGLGHNLRTLKQRWENVTARANDKKIKLEIALKEATEFHDALQTFVDWLTNAEKILTNLKPVSRVMETILSQIEEHKSFQKDVGVHRETMLNLDKKGTHLKYFSQKQDVILIKNLLISVQHRWERVVSKSAERTRALDHGYKEAREFHDAWSGLINWLEETERTLDEVAVDGLGGNDPERIKSRLNKHRDIQKGLGAKQGTYDSTMKNGKALKDKAPKTDEYALKELLNELKNKWTTVCGKCVDRQRKLEEALLFSGQFKDAIQALLEWLGKTERHLSDTGPLYGDLDTVTNLVERHKTFEKDLESRASQMESVMKTGRELESKATPEDASGIGVQLRELAALWETVTRLSTEKSSRLDQALREAERLHKAVHVLLEWLGDAEMKLRFAGQLPEDEQESRNRLMEHEDFLRELQAKEIEKDLTLELSHAILAKAHPDGAAVIKHWITIIQSRWEEVATWAHQRNQRLETHMRGLQDLDNLLEELLSWLEGLENTLNALEAETLPDDRSTLEMLIADHREFMENASRRQNEVDRVCKARQVKPPKETRKTSKTKSPASARASPGRERTPELSLPHIGPRFPPKGSKGAEPEFRSPRVKLLWDRWRHVWMLAWERQRRLQDKYNYIQELDRVANFSWEDWRKRFLKFMNHKKSRLTDLFRKMDKNNDGLIPREDFIQGIMNTKFETSRLEMGAVADLFDRHGEGLIDWKEFIAALRPDWEERRTYNDTDKIHDEVKRLVMLCTCRQKFRVFQVGEGKYRFGDSQKLRLVRILRSTVMVRVGGGWVALDEFLLKNDPCRAKGRTNIELREQFILADGVSQTMTAFRSKPSPTSTLQRTQISSAGPITKVRERSARSVPMGQQSRASRSSLSAGTPDSLSDNESSFRMTTARKTPGTTYRSTLTPGSSRPSSRPTSRPTSRPASRPGSRPASRQGSKPPSRYGSTQSLDSTDDSGTPSRIPRRTGANTTGNTPSSSRHNSVSGKKLSTPVNGSSSRPRTPTGLISPASGVPARFGSIHRASSIPTLTGVGTPIRSSSVCTNSATNIPSAVKHARTRTPSSGSSTPLPPSLKMARKPSGTSDTSVSGGAGGTSTTTGGSSTRKGKPTPIDQRAPFRL